MLVKQKYHVDNKTPNSYRKHGEQEEKYQTIYSPFFIEQAWFLNLSAWQFKTRKFKSKAQPCRFKGGVKLKNHNTV